MALSFEWLPAKAADNVRKHGVSFGEASSVFGDPFARILEDPRHSISEQRFAIIGLSVMNRLLAVMFTERGTRVRLISARRATRRERLDYEEAQR